MNTTHTLKNKNVIKLNNRKNRIHKRNKKNTYNLYFIININYYRNLLKKYVCIF